ncbi:MAG: imidazoleglycerol-phosphate dehydratase, partial [Candidatus Heimdallarchaeota archaeon]
SGRAYLQFQARFRRQYCGDLDTDLVEHFFEAVARGAGMNIVIKLLAGKNDHHKLEAIFKAFARAIRDASAFEPRIQGVIPSSKEVLDL